MTLIEKLEAIAGTVLVQGVEYFDLTEDDLLTLIEHAKVEQLAINDYEEVLASQRQLVKELDSLLNGEAARQASLCDIVSQLRKAKAEKQEPVAVYETYATEDAEFGAPFNRFVYKGGYKPKLGDKLYTTPQTDLVTELVEALEWALSCIHFDDDDLDMQEAIRCRDKAITLFAKAKETMK